MATFSYNKDGFKDYAFLAAAEFMAASFDYVKEFEKKNGKLGVAGRQAVAVALANSASINYVKSTLADGIAGLINAIDRLER
jgi:hypothetical protein